jgi:hypothetical protein
VAFQFNTYSVEELRECGCRLREDLSRMVGPTEAEAWETATWTDEIKRWFWQALAEGAYCYGQPFTSEYGYDQCHSATDLTLSPKPEKFLLVLESEWGAWRSIGKGRDLIVDDAHKVVRAQAIAKVMVFGSNGTQDRNWILQKLSAMRNAKNDVTPWLWLDVSWEYNGSDPQQIQYGLFTAN